MCCESCPGHEECSIDDRLKDKCCPKRPDYETCFNRKEEYGEWDE